MGRNMHRQEGGVGLISNSFFFPSGVTLRVFLFYFVFPLKNKTKISGDSKSFLKIIFSPNQVKKQVVSSSGNALSKMQGSHKGFSLTWKFSKLNIIKFY